MRRAYVILIIFTIVLSWAIPYSAHTQTEQIPTEQQTTPTPDQTSFSTANLTKELFKFEFWLVLLLTLIIGAVGGVVYELLILQGNIEKPHKPSQEESEEKFPYAINPAIKYNVYAA